MDGQRAPVGPTSNTKQTHAPKKTGVMGVHLLSTFADVVSSYLTAGDAWPNMPPAHRSLLLMQRTAGNRAVAQYLATGSRLNEPLEKSELRANSISADKTHSETAALIQSLAHEEGLQEVPLDREDESKLKNNNGDKTVSRTLTSGDDQRSSGRRWGSAASGGPIPVSWAALQSMGALGPEFGSQVSGPPGSTDLTTIEGHGGAGARGWTYFPTNFKAPDFNFNSTDKGAAGTPQWYASPTSKVTAFEGDANAYYPSAAIHKVAHKEGGKNTYRDVSAAISGEIQVNEQEHCDDHAEAYKISLKEAEDILTSKVYGKDFGPKPTKAEAEQLVLDTIKSNLTHAGLGEDKTKWGPTYNTLMRKTNTRDTSGWHTYGIANRRTNAAGDVIYDLVRSATTKSGTVKSSTIIKY